MTSDKGDTPSRRLHAARRDATVSSADGGATETRVPVERRWRPDIQGLRAIAILGVVGYHADPGLIRGGFAGVDVFYVISGFLITGMLVRELERTHRISFGRFYARRIRRLLPMALLVLFVTVGVADLVQSPLDAARTAKDALSSALYVANYRFALQQTNYLDASNAPSPFQHYWSLGVEEQMYIIWPLLLFLAAVAWRRRRPSTRTAGVFLALGTVASFVACVRLTHSNEPWAFFSFPTRAWELGVGGLVAFAAPTLRTLARPIAWIAGIGGLGAIVWSIGWYRATTPWPGTAAAIPVLGAAAVIAAGCARGRSPTGWVLALPPFQLIGRISYSWYLWHWPALILAPYVTGHPLSTRLAWAVAGGSGIVAVASYYTVEQPLHVSRWLAGRARRGLALGFGLTTTGVGLCIASVAALALPVATATATPVRHALTAPSRQTNSTVAADIGLLGNSTNEIQSDLTASEGVTDVPDDLTPTLSGAFNDLPQLYQDGCIDSFTSVALGTCTYGDPNGSKSVVVFGDSHAAMWVPAIADAANAYDWKVYAWAKDTCPPIELSIYSPDLGRPYTECDTWRDAVLAQIAAIHPALVVLGVARHYSPIYGFTMDSQDWYESLAAMVTTIRAMGPRVLVIGPVPKPSRSVPSCLSENLEDAPTCGTLRGRGVDLPGMRDEEIAVTGSGGEYINTLFWFCSKEKFCPPIVNDVLVYRDDNHITATYAGLLTSPVGAALDLAMRGEPAPGSAVLLSPPG